MPSKPDYTIKRNGLEARIYQDRHRDDEYDPREADNLGTMACWHRNYNLGDVDGQKVHGDGKAFLETLHDTGAIVIPLHLYDHSGITMRTSSFRHIDPGGWDSGIVGFIYCTRADIQKEFGDASDASYDKAREVLEVEVKEYDRYLRGEIFTIQIVRVNPMSDEPDLLDAFGGFIGREYAEACASEMLDEYADRAAPSDARFNVDYRIDMEDLILLAKDQGWEMPTDTETLRAWAKYALDNALNDAANRATEQGGE